MRRDLALVLALAFAGCNSNLCARNSDCKAGLMCSSDGVCVAKSSDGDDDSSTVDAPTDTVDAPGETDAADAAEGEP